MSGVSLHTGPLTVQGAEIFLKAVGKGCSILSRLGLGLG